MSYYLFLWPCTSSTNLSGFREWPCTFSTKLSRFPLWYIQFLVCSTFIAHEIRQFGSQFDWKSKTSLFTFLNVYVFWIEWDKILISQLSPLKFRYFTDQKRPGEGPSIIVLQLPKIVHFLHICADLSKKSKSVKAIFLYPSGRPDHALSESTMFYKGLSNSSRDIEE